jgi:hypothetical protein
MKQIDIGPCIGMMNSDTRLSSARKEIKTKNVWAVSSPDLVIKKGEKNGK